MASKDPPDELSNLGEANQPLSPTRRKRLQQCFEAANMRASQENYDYATDLFTQCVAGDPGNLLYLQSFLTNLKKKYNNNKKGSNLAAIRVSRHRSACKKGVSQKKWDVAMKAGLEALKLNPWDVGTLTHMANAVSEMGFHDVQLQYLKMALEANSRDPNVNRLCANALREMGQFDQAIACWHRVEKERPNDEEPAREIARLAVEKTIQQGGYTDPDRTSASLAEQQSPQNQQQQQQRVTEVTPEQRLEEEIGRHPNDIPKYIELADLHISRERYDRADEVLGRAFEASDGADEVRERWEDAQMRHLRQKVSKAEKEAKKDDTPEAKQKCDELREQLNVKEIEVHENRVKRYPNNFAHRYDLGLRYQMSSRYNEAIAEYQQARNDPRKRGLCMLALGQCFQQIKQYRLAMSHYEEAIKEIPDRDPQNRKLALYLAGRLATAIKDLDKGEKHLTALAGLDFGYRDVSALLDKIAKLRENQEKGTEQGVQGEPPAEASPPEPAAEEEAG